MYQKHSQTDSVEISQKRNTVARNRPPRHYPNKVKFNLGMAKMKLGPIQATKMMGFLVSTKTCSFHYAPDSHFLLLMMK